MNGHDLCLKIVSALDVILTNDHCSRERSDGPVPSRALDAKNTTISLRIIGALQLTLTLSAPEAGQCISEIIPRPSAKSERRISDRDLLQGASSLKHLF
jgi:hypothetical protein